MSIRIPAFPYKRLAEDEKFKNWTDGVLDEWVFYSTVCGTPKASSIMTEETNGVRIQQDSSTGGFEYLMAHQFASTKNTNVIIGHEYGYRTNVHSIDAGQVEVYTGGNPKINTITSPGIYTGTFTCSISNADSCPSIGYYFGSLDCVIVSFDMWDLTLEYTPTRDILGNLLTNVGGCVSNDAGCHFVYQAPTDTTTPDTETGKILNTITVVDSDGTDATLVYGGFYGTKPYWMLASNSVYWSSVESKWAYYTDSTEYFWDTASGSFPPMGVANSDDATISLSFSRWWLDTSTEDTEPLRVDHADWLARINGTQDQLDKWDKKGSGDACHVVQSVLYPYDTTLYVYALPSTFGWDLPDTPPPGCTPPLTYVPQATHQLDVTVDGDFVSAAQAVLNAKIVSWAGDDCGEGLTIALFADDGTTYLYGDDGKILTTD